MPWLRPTARRGFPLAAGLAVFCALLASFTPLTAKTKRQRAADHFQTASSLLADLKAVPRYELGPEQFLVVIRAFRKVWYTSPASGYCDDSLLAAANLYQEAADRFSSDQYRQRALQTFGFLIREYPHSKHKTEAQAALEELAQPIGAKPLETSTASLDPAPSQAPQSSGRKTQAPQLASPNAATEVAVATLNTPARREPPASEATSVAPAPPRGPARVKDLRFWSNDHYTRVVIEVDKETNYKFNHLPRPARLYFDLLGTRLSADLKNSPALTVNDERIKQIRLGQNRRSMARVVFDLRSPVRYRASWLSNPPRLVVEVRPSEDNAFVAETIDSPSSDQNPSTALPRPAKPSERALAKTKDPVRPRQPVPQSPETETKAAEQPDGEAIAATNRSMPSGTPKSSPADDEDRLREVHADAPASGAANAIAGKAVATPSVALAHVGAEDPRPPQTSGAKTTETDGSLARRKPGAQPLKLDGRPPDKETPGNAVALSEPQSPAPPAERDAVLLAKAVPPSLPLPPPKPASATLRGKRNLIRALGLKVGRVVIDPGHGGHDTGGVGPNGLREKDLVLDVALRLGKLIEEKMGSEVVYTRTDDRFLSLRQRTKKANRNDADLFVSIHANSSRMRGIRGVETYYLSLTTNSWALAVASRENAAAERSIHELRDLLSKIALTEKIEESREFATHVQSSLYKGLASKTKGLRDRGVRKAPFMVLLGVEMPAILAEVGFLSNPRDEKLLKTSAYRQKIAEHLYKGISRYSESLSHVTLAQKASSGSARND